MTETRLRTNIRVQAMLWRCSAAGAVPTVARRGDQDAGALLVKSNNLQGGFFVLTETRDAQGRLAWLRGTGPATVDEATADAYIARQVKYDPDIWVVEIEDRLGRTFVDGEP